MKVSVKEKLALLAILIFNFYGTGLSREAREKQGCRCRWTKDERANFDIPFEENYLGNNENDDLQDNCTFRLIEFFETKDEEWECQQIDFQQKQTLPKFNSDKQENLLRKFTTVPQNETVLFANDTRLNCAFSTPAPWCYWTKDGDVVAIEGRYSFAGSKKSGNCSINISNASMLDNGLWECHYPKTTEQSKMYSGSSKLHVVVLPSPPIITVNGLKQKDGQTVYIKVKTRQEKKQVNLHGYNRWSMVTVYVPTNAIDISCWSLNGHPAATLQWSGLIPINPLSSDENITPSKFPSLYNSKVTFSLGESDPTPHQQTSLTCSYKEIYFADLPNLPEKHYSTTVGLVFSVTVV